MKHLRTPNLIDWVQDFDLLIVQTTDIVKISKHIAQLPKKNTQRPRYVVFTQGADETVVAKSSNGEEATVETFTVPKFDASSIVDTNGAGDAFAGAFVAGLVQGKDISASVDLGHWLAQLCLKENGPQ